MQRSVNVSEFSRPDLPSSGRIRRISDRIPSKVFTHVPPPVEGGRRGLRSLGALKSKETQLRHFLFERSAPGRPTDRSSYIRRRHLSLTPSAARPSASLGCLRGGAVARGGGSVEPPGRDRRQGKLSPGDAKLCGVWSCWGGRNTVTVEGGQLVLQQRNCLSTCPSPKPSKSCVATRAGPRYQILRPHPPCWTRPPIAENLPRLGVSVSAMSAIEEPRIPAQTRASSGEFAANSPRVRLS